MKKKNKIKIKIAIKKNYKENMETETEKTLKSAPSNDPKEEDYSWVEENDTNLINNYKRFPFEEWEKIIEKLGLANKITDNKKMYQETCCKVLEEDVFKNEKFMPENNPDNIDIFPNFLNEKNIIYKEFLFSSIKPDFIVNGIPKENFIAIFDMRDYMFKYDKEYNVFNNIDTINIIGELKVNPDNIKIDQKNRYITFCEYSNIFYKKNEYFMTLYIFDVSYKKFFSKTLYIGKPIIFGFIPKLFKNDYLEIYRNLKKRELDIKTDIFVNQSGDKIFKENKEFPNNIIIKNNINNNANKESAQKEIQNNNKRNNEINEQREKNNLDYNTMSKKELLCEVRKKEDLILSKERDLEDEKLKFKNEKLKLEEKILIYKRSKEDSFLKKKRQIENERLELENLNGLYEKSKIQ